MRTLITLTTCFLLSAPLSADEQNGATAAVTDEEIHEELRALRTRLFEAYQKRDLDALLNNVAPNVVITWQNGEHNVGHDQFRAFYDKMMTGDNRIVDDITSEVEVDDVSTLYSKDTAVARGSLSDHFVLADGSDFVLNSRWTATVCKMEDGWKVTSFHVSANIFDNPILSVAQGAIMKVAGITGFVALILGIIIGRISRRKATAN